MIPNMASVERYLTAYYALRAFNPSWAIWSRVSSPSLLPSRPWIIQTVLVTVETRNISRGKGASIHLIPRSSQWRSCATTYKLRRRTAQLRTWPRVRSPTPSKTHPGRIPSGHVGVFDISPACAAMAVWSPGGCTLCRSRASSATNDICATSFLTPAGACELVAVLGSSSGTHSASNVRTVDQVHPSHNS